MMRLVVPARETATPQVINDAVPSIYLNVQHKISIADGHAQATTWSEKAKTVLKDLTPNKPQAPDTHQTGPHGQAAETPAQTYGLFLDLCAPHVLENPDVIHPKDERDPCPVCNGNRLMTGHMARYDYGGCECHPTVITIRQELLDAMLKPAEDRLPPDRILEIADRYATEAFMSGKSIGYNDGRATGAENW